VRVFVGFLILLFLGGVASDPFGNGAASFVQMVVSVKCPILFESPIDWNLSLSCALSRLTHLHFC
jgi:hypothetical protein